jgi:phage terminase large subunit GpA-like protein
VATNPNPSDPECHSYKITALYSLNTSWGEILVKFLQAKDDFEKLKELKTQYLGQAWKQVAASVSTADIDNIIDISPVYHLGNIPESLEDGLLLGGVDRQMDRFYYVIQALCNSGNSYVVDYGCVASFEDLAKLEHQTYKDIDGKEYTLSKALIDEGGFANKPVRDFCIQTEFLFVPCKGRGDLTKGAMFNNGDIEYPLGTGNRIPYVTVNDGELKKLLILNTIKYKKGNLFLPKNLSDDFKRQVTNEEFVLNKQGEYEWKTKGRVGNHYLDCMKYIEALKEYNRPRLKSNIVEVNLTDAK